MFDKKSLGLLTAVFVAIAFMAGFIHGVRTSASKLDAASERFAKLAAIATSPDCDCTNCPGGDCPCGCCGSKETKSNFNFLDVGTLTANCIMVQHPGSSHKISMLGSKDGAGIWLDGNKATVSIYGSDEQTYIGIYDKRRGVAGSPAFALHVGTDGEPLLQVRDASGKTRNVNLLGFQE